MSRTCDRDRDTDATSVYFFIFFSSLLLQQYVLSVIQTQTNQILLLYLDPVVGIVSLERLG